MVKKSFLISSVALVVFTFLLVTAPIASAHSKSNVKPASCGWHSWDSQYLVNPVNGSEVGQVILWLNNCNYMAHVETIAYVTHASILAGLDNNWTGGSSTTRIGTGGVGAYVNSSPDISWNAGWMSGAGNIYLAVNGPVASAQVSG